MRTRRTHPHRLARSAPWLTHSDRRICRIRGLMRPTKTVDSRFNSLGSDECLVTCKDSGQLRRRKSSPAANLNFRITAPCVMASTAKAEAL